MKANLTYDKYRINTDDKKSLNLTFNYDETDKANEEKLYNFFVSELIPKYGVNSEKCEELKECISPYLVDENGEITTTSTRVGGTDIPDAMFDEVMSELLENMDIEYFVNAQPYSIKTKEDIQTAHDILKGKAIDDEMPNLEDIEPMFEELKLEEEPVIDVTPLEIEPTDLPFDFETDIDKEEQPKEEVQIEVEEKEQEDEEQEQEEQVQEDLDKMSVEQLQEKLENILEEVTNKKEELSSKQDALRKKLISKIRSAQEESKSLDIELNKINIRVNGDLNE